MKVLVTLALTCMIFFSCAKSGKSLQETCFKGRFIEQGCWTVIEVLEPVDQRLPLAQYRDFKHAIGAANLPDMYKSGQPFYFTAVSIDSNMISLAYCLPTKYMVEIGNVSYEPCGEN